MDIPRTSEIIHNQPADDHIVLTYDARFLRRKRLVSASGCEFIVDFPTTRSVDHGDAFKLGDGRLIQVQAAHENLQQVTGDLPRLAWHIGNRHTPCQIEDTRLVIKADHVLAEMIKGLGGHVIDVIEPFRPEGGAYGHGRTMGHDH